MNFKVIKFVYDAINQPSKLPEYVIIFGNLENGYGCKTEELKEVWTTAIRNSKTKAFGDISLYRNGKLIRAIHNANVPILYRRRDGYNYVCRKFNYSHLNIYL